MKWIAEKKKKKKKFAGNTVEIACGGARMRKNVERKKRKDDLYAMSNRSSLYEHPIYRETLL